MKKKIIYGWTVLVLAGVSAFNLTMNSQVNSLSDSILTNIEVLAKTEDIGGGDGGWCDSFKTCTSKSDCDVLTQYCGLNCNGVKKCY